MSRRKPDWQAHVIQWFESNQAHVYSRGDIQGFLAENRESLGMPVQLSLTRLIRFLTEESNLRAVEIPRLPPQQIERSPRPSSESDWTITRPFLRYVWGEASPLEVASSLRKRSYLSHATAVLLHGLTAEIPKTVYANKEQSPKPSPAGGLSQAGIDRAFKNRPRTSNFLFSYEGNKIVLLSGKNTGDLEVSEFAVPGSPPLRATKLERTLIDITVRPNYAGGVFEVLKAFKGARDRASVATLIATLARLEYVYPYHQAIGFYMELAGYPAKHLDRLKQEGLDFDFYLSNQIHNPGYSSSWRVHYPKELAYQ